jgi:hypothetical protein
MTEEMRQRISELAATVRAAGGKGAAVAYIHPDDYKVPVPSAVGQTGYAQDPVFVSIRRCSFVPPGEVRLVIEADE